MVARQRKFGRAGQPRDEAGVDHGVGDGVIFAYRRATQARHEERVTRQRECGGPVQPCDEVGIDRGTGGDVVFAHGTSDGVTERRIGS